MIMAISRREHPKPQFVRDDWQNLNGKWLFSIDGGKSGAARGMHLPEGKKEFDKTINVPFAPESVLSGVNIKDFMECVWYRRTFDLDEINGRVILHFGACDYKTTVWINGIDAGYHIGGYVSFSFDITEYVKVGENLLVVRAEDYQRTGRQPSGKQCYAYNSERCSYTRTTGIWQTVWLE
ncbi:MAG: beta-galactosidase, partial [Clostridia bacterium]|nr:beta-galactosidase [Clostridia bacterium]